jgi:hypothetical protein
MQRIKLAAGVVAALAVLAFAAVAAVSTVEAAQKLVDVKTLNVPVTQLGVNACSASDDFVATVDTAVTAWDNGHVRVHVAASGKIVDSVTGEKLGSAGAVQQQVAGQGGLPLTVNIQQKVTCEGSGLNDAFTIHTGITIDENGVPHPH